jgi:hypothetical protein
MATKEQNGPSEVKEFLPVRSNALGAFDHSYGQMQRHMVECRSSQPASHVVALADPRSPSLLAMRHGGYLRSNVECTI